MLRKIVDWTNAAVTAGLGVYLLVRCFGWLHGEASPWWLPVFLAGLALLAINAALLLQAYRGGDLARNLRITTEGGSTALSVAALEQELAANLARQKDIASPKIVLEPQGNGLPVICRLSCRLAGRGDVLGRVDVLKRQVREIFLAMFPGGIGLEIHAEVLGFAGRGEIVTPTETAVAAAEEAGKAKPEFTGPVFPIPPAHDGPRPDHGESSSASGETNRREDDFQPVYGDSGIEPPLAGIAPPFPRK